MAPSGSFLLRTEGKALELWNLDVGLRIAHIPAFGETAWDAVWSRDELRVLVRMAKEIAAIEVGTGRIAWVADFPERAFALAPDGSRAAGLHENPQSREVDAIQVWTLEDAPCP
jgi:hypothetical protein